MRRTHYVVGGMVKIRNMQGNNWNSLSQLNFELSFAKSFLLAKSLKFTNTPAASNS